MIGGRNENELDRLDAIDDVVVGCLKQHAHVVLHRRRLLRHRNEGLV